MAGGVKKRAARKTMDMKNMSFAWCESMKGRKGEEGRRRGGALKREVR